MKYNKFGEIINDTTTDDLAKEKKLSSILLVTAIVMSVLRLMDELFVFRLYRSYGRFAVSFDRVITLAFLVLIVFLVVKAFSLSSKGVRKAYLPAIISFGTAALIFVLNVYLWLPGIWFAQNKDDMSEAAEKLLSGSMSIEEFERSEYSRLSDREIIIDGKDKVFFTPFYGNDNSFLGYLYSPEEKIGQFKIDMVKYRVKGGKDGWYSICSEDTVYKFGQN